jgi:hypothetical protein
LLKADAAWLEANGGLFADIVANKNIYATPDLSVLGPNKTYVWSEQI